MSKRYLLGIDVGSSSVKTSLVDADSGKCAASAFFPEKEAPITAVKAGWAEQDPQMWWNNMKLGLKKIMADAGATAEDVKAIGISYQMHGLVCVDKDLQALRPSIIWCDSRAVPYGEKAFNALGADQCLTHLLNSPGNFTAAKLAWVKENVCYTHQATITRPMPDKQLKLSWNTFRDRLTPGQQEEWSLTVLAPDGQPANAQLMATLYDKSLDQLTLHFWSL